VPRKMTRREILRLGAATGLGGGAALSLAVQPRIEDIFASRIPANLCYATVRGVGVATTPCPIMYRTSGDGCLCGFDILSDGNKYLRISNFDPAEATTPAISTVGEASVAIVDPSVANLTLSWSAQFNDAAVDINHNTLPMLMEDAPGGNNFIGFQFGNGFSRALCISDGTATSASIELPSSNAVHSYKIVIVEPGARIDFSVDNSVVASISTNVPSSSKMFAAAELDQDETKQDTISHLWTFGGILS
jgi:hypothetical protein